MHIREPVVTTLESERQLRVIKAQEVQDRGVQVVHMHGVLNCIESQIVRLTVDQSTLEPTPCHPNTEGSIVVIATVIASLDHRCAAELAPPDDQGIVEHPETLEVFDKCRTGSVGGVRVVFDICG